ncbi:Linear gramicidin synthase subunit D [compost metagenome]
MANNMERITLTPYQTIFYYEWLQDPDRSDYNIVIDNTIVGEIDKKKYNDSFEQMLNEHFITRHNIDDGLEGAFWVPREPVFNLVTYHDTPLTDEEIYALVSAPFDLRNGPLVRIHLISLGAERYRTLFIFHHIVVDGISTEEIWDKWRKRYNGIDYQVPSLQEQGVMHQQLCHNFATLLQEKGEQMREFWRERLGDLEGVDLRFLQTGRQLTTAATRRQIGELLFGFDEDISRRVKLLLRKYKLTTYLFGQMVMALLLHKMSGQKSVALAYPVAISEGKDLLYGAHINTLAIDYRFADDATIRSVIASVHRYYKSLKQTKAKYLPVHEILACGEATGVLDVAFAQTFLRDHQTHFSGVVDESANHDFHIDLVNELLFEQEVLASGINYRVRFDSNVLDAALVENFIELYKDLFINTLDKLLAGEVDTPINSITLIAQLPHHTQHVCAGAKVPQHSIVEQFERMAATYPARNAVVCGNQTLSYQQLNQQANRLADYLRCELRIKSGDFVALCLEKSAAMPVCILAVLKTGAAYVPLNPGEAGNRLSFILQDTQAKAILGDSASVSYLNEIAELPQVPIIAVDNLQFQRDLVAQQQSENLDIAIDLKQLAYIIYTSGTTGKPKGVMIEHAGLINLARVQGEAFGLAPSEASVKQCLWYAAYVFDAHVSELFTAIANGHVIHILLEDKRKDFDALAAYIADASIDIATIPPALLDKNSLLALSTLVVAGEPCNREIMQRYRAQGTTVINAYGPTESSVCATLHYYENGDSNLNIGLPLLNLDVHVLDEHLAPVPVGVIGELYISGVGLARGYLNDPQQTERAFIANPFQSDAQKQRNEAARLYKTGDLVRRLADGHIEYVGRRDFQLKIRGFRIELSEIEMQLVQIPQIIQSAVIAHKLPTGALSLVAYYVADVAVDKEQIIGHLADALPDYMIPLAYVHLTAFPMTVNGKLNRKALPLPDLSGQDDYVAPADEMERALCQIYGEILGQAPGQVGVNDDFFKLGGDSISAIQMVRMIRQRLKGTASVKEIFDCKTVRLLARNIVLDSDEHHIKHLSESGMLSGPAQLLPIQQWFFDRVDQGTFAAYQHWNQSFVLDVPPLDIGILNKSLALLFAYHDALRLVFTRDGNGGYSQHYQSDVGEIPLSVIDEPVGAEQQIALFDRWQSEFDIFGGKLCHIGYITSENAPRAKLHFAFHHLIMDAVSWHIIKQDLERIYRALEANAAGISDPVEILGDKPTSYRQWAAQVQDYANHQGANEETLYWRTVIGGLGDYRQRIAPLFTSPSLSQRELSLNKTLTQHLLGGVHHVFNTQVNDLLLASFVEILNEFTGLHTQYLTLEGHGREALDTSVDINRTVGWLTTMYPVRLSSEGDWRQRIVTVKETVGGIPRRGVGFAPLMGYDADQLPPVSFNYLGRFDEVQQEGWCFSPTNSGQTVAHENGEAHLLSVNCGVVGGELRIRLSGYLTDDVLQHLASRYQGAIAGVIERLLAESRTYLTARDIDGVIPQATLDALQRDTELESVYLANSLQEGFIYHALSQGEVDDAYHTQMFWDYDNALDIDCLKQAWLQAQQHYPTLRLRFDWDEELVQIVDAHAALNWHFFDLSGKSEHQQQAFFSDLSAQDRARPYDLSISGIFRVYVVKNADERYRCIFSCHHAIMDGWSNPLLIEAVHKFYLALLRGDTLPQACDHGFHQVQRYIQSHKSEHLPYWRDYLAAQDEPEDLNILLCGQAKHVQLNEYKHIKTSKTQQLMFDEPCYQQLKSFTAENAITLNALLQYCWHKVLSIYSGNAASIVGTVVSGRNLPVDGIDQTVGLLINTLPLIVDHQASVSVLTAIQNLQDAINEANTRSHVNLAQLQPAGKRLFNSLFVYENYPMPSGDIDSDLRLRFASANEKQDYPLVVTVLEQQHLALSLHYAGELFDDVLIEQLLNTMRTLVENIVQGASQSQTELPYLQAAQYQTIIHQWNDTRRPYEHDKTLAALFEARVAASPDSVAVEFNDVVLTYAQLNQQANQLAHYLQQCCQLRANDLVGLYLERSEQLVIAILAILKAGAAYVPMDPDSPDERNGYIIADAKVKAVLCQRQALQRVDLMAPGAMLIPLDAPDTTARLARCATDNPCSNTGPEDLAYVIYTSGTTGYPKGTLIEQRCVNRLVINPNYVEIGEQDRILGISGYQFDASIYDIFGALLNGAALVIADKPNILDLDRLSQLIVDRQISNFFATTAFFNTLVDAELPGLQRLNYLLFGGEQVSVNHVNRFRTLYPQVKLVHVYGPTETTTYATAYLTNTATQAFDYTVPIGQPISNTQLYILDEQLRPVPQGAIGELYIGGAGVGRGYLNNPQATSDAFIANPFRSDAERSRGENARLYKTGDQGRYLPDGNIEYLGRNDFQVKIRGFRIELGEIEARLIDHPAIQQALVLASTNPAGHTHLTAYYVAQDPLEQDVLRAHLQQVLPDYMVPSALVHLLSLPMTVNGKVDRAALPVPTFEAQADRIAPETATEQQLTEVFAELLAIPQDSLSVLDDFYRLGGNSILAIKLVGRLTRALEKSVHVSDLFRLRSIRALAAFIDNTAQGCGVIQAPSIARPEEQRLSFAQERLWFIDRYEEGSNAYNVPLTLKLQAGTDPQKVAHALMKVIARHEALRTLILCDDDGQGYQQILPAETFSLTISHEICDSVQALHARLHEHQHRVFDLAQECPIAASSYTLAGADYFSIVIHHIAFDGWSVDLLLKELLHYYRVFTGEASNELPAPPVQYREFALWQRQHLQGATLDKQLAYWHGQLADHEALNLPTDHVRPLQLDYRGDDITFQLDATTSAELRALAASLNVSLYTVLLSGYYLLLGVYSNQQDIVLGTPIAGRHYPGVEDTMGLFVNTLVLRRQIDVSQTVREFIGETGQQVSEAHTHQDLPFEKLVEVLKAEKDSSRHPIFQVMFSLQSFGATGRTEGESLFEQYDAQEGAYRAAKFDLTVMMDDSEEAISGVFNYATALFHGQTMRNYIATYQHILRQLGTLCSQGRSLAELQYLDTAQYEQIICQGNRTECDYPREMTIHEMFEAQVARTPENIALVFEGVSLTYRQLNERANRLAAYLRAQFVLQPDDLIGLCLERSERMIVSILAVLKAGAAYVPLSPDMPAERMLWTIENIHSRVILTELGTQEALAKLIDPQQTALLCVDDPELIAQAASHPVVNVATQTRPDNLIYVIYTSGTTGTPKGVMIEHHSVANLVEAQRSIFGTEICQAGEPTKSYLFYSNYTFDAHVLDVFSPLLTGHCLHVLSKEIRLNFAALAAYIKQHAIDIGFVPPALLNNNETLGLSTLILGGEVASSSVIERYSAQGVKIVNCYGPTETTVFVTRNVYQTGDSNTIIGRPIGNADAYILDSCLRPLPAGAVGELYISGDCVGRGYLNNPEATHQAFIVNPLQSDEDKARGRHDRLYKTGDLVRYLNDGKIDYIGRNDAQVKIRGFRIELAEIESCLSQYPQIEQVVVLALEHDSGQKYLVAYYVAPDALPADVLSEHLQQRLPAYMIPTAFVHLTALPMNMNNKLDRKALPLPILTDEVNYVAPANESEMLICRVFAEVLQLKDYAVGVTDDFFRLGGDSISSIQLANKLKKLSGHHLTVKDIFAHRTAKALSTYLLQRQGDNLPVIQSEAGMLADEFPLAPIQRWFFQAVESGKLPDAGHWNQAFMVKVPTLNVELLRLSVAKLVEYHDILRAVYPKDAAAGHYRQTIATLPFDAINQQDFTAVQLDAQLTAWQNRFCLAEGPLFHIGYIAGYADETARIHVAVHHLNIDAVSWRIINQDLRTLYQFFAAQGDNLDATVDAQTILGQKGTSYRQWVNSLQNYPAVAVNNHRDERHYWDNLTTELDAWHQRLDAHRVGTLNRTMISLSPEHTGCLLRDLHHVYHTEVNDILLTVLADALSQVVGGDSQYVLLEGHGREAMFDDVDINNTVGWFTCMYPVNLRIEQRDLVRNLPLIKDRLRTPPHHGLGYGVLVGYDAQALPAVTFNYLGQFDGDERDGEWAFVQESTGSALSANNRTTDFLALNGGVLNGQLQFLVEGDLSPEQLELFATTYRQRLIQLIDELKRSTRSYLTESDVKGVVSGELLARLQQDEEVAAIYPANSLQQGFIYHYVLQGDIDNAYRTQMVWHYRNALDVELLKRAWQCSQAKYPALRLRFSWQEEFVQIVDQQGTFGWQFIDISEQDERARASTVAELVKQDQQTHFDLSASGLFRLYIVKCADDHYICLFNNHHAILDGWSLPILLNDVHQNYLALQQGSTPEQTTDQSYLEAQALLQTVSQETEQFWQHYLGGLEVQENLTGLLKPEMKHVNLSEYKHLQDPQTVSTALAGELYHGLKALSRQHGVTLNALMQYCWHQQLSLYSHADVTIVGMTVSGRNLPVEEIERSVGLYINTLPVVLAHTDEAIIENVKRLQAHINDINSYSNISLITLQKAGVRLFNSLFVFENYPVPADNGESLFKLEFEDSDEKLDYPLGIMVYEQDGRIEFKINYAGELFSRSAIEGVLQGIRLTVQQLIADPAIVPQALSLLTQDNYTQLVANQPRVQVAVERHKRVGQMFEEQAARTPDALALVYQDTRLTYRELNQRVNQLAAYLQANFAIQPDSAIALYFDKSTHMVIAMLAVLKAGAAYVPISPQAPLERLSLLVDDVKPVLILTQQHYGARIAGCGFPLLDIDNPQLANRLAQIDDSNVQSRTQPDDLAYIIYTSGTTGRPKGVMIEHHSLINLAQGQSDLLGMPTGYEQAARLNTLWYSEYVFDAHALDVFCALLNGHCLHILAEQQRLDFIALSAYIRDHAIEFAFIPPALLAQNELLELSTLVVGGECLDAAMIDRYCEAGVRLINGYGPSETTVWATARIYQPGDANTNIGKAINNVCVYLLDRHLRPVPQGAIGELYIGGAGVGRGYLNNPQATADAFIANPFRSDAERSRGENARLYKTGDRGRYLPDGNIEYLGRNDFQVKIRGFRIEPGEIEARLNDHPAIQQALVLASTNPAGHTHLTAYYVAQEPLEQEMLRDHLQQVLPDYMVPSALVHLLSLPMTVNGKVDRAALPVPTFEAQADRVAPETATEQQLAEVFAELLAIPQDSLSVLDDFYRLGGNSILAIKLVGRLTRALEKSVHVSDLFRLRSIRALAAFIDNTAQGCGVIQAPSIARPEEQRLSFAQERLWFIDRYEEGSNAYNIPLTLKLQAGTDPQKVAQALMKVVDRHEVLRTLILCDDDGQGYQHILPAETFSLSISHETCDSVQALHARLHEHQHRVFDLAQECPIVAQCYTLAGADYFSIVIHHIAFDGWSVDLLLKELLHYYRVFTGEASNELPAPPVQYREFALWQRQHLQGATLDKQLAYWHGQLADHEPLNLPTDHVRPLQLDYRGDDITFQLDAVTSAELRALAASLNVSLYTVLLSGYYLLLGVYSNQRDIVLGTPIAGRHYPGVEDTMGLFVNTLVLRRQIDVSQTVREFIGETGQQVSEAHTHQDLPFEKLVEVLKTEKDSSRHPIFQVMFSLQSFGAAGRTEGESLFEQYDAQEGAYRAAKFDLTVMLDDSEEAIGGVFNYATALFNGQTMQNYIATYQHILRQLGTLCSQGRSLAELQYLDSAQYEQIIFQGNRTECDYPREMTIHGMFEAQVARTPENIALVFEGVSLTYRQLNERANRLSVYLRERFAVRTGDLVALCLNRSEHMQVAILAILKAGGAYVPLDPLAPDDRVSYMLDNAGIDIILTAHPGDEKAAALAATGRTVIDVADRETSSDIARYPGENQPSSVRSSDLAYIIYTSGTTGNPKGVMLEHHSVINRIVWMHKQYPITAQDRILQKTNYTFDVSVWELFWANWYGACIVFASQEAYKDNVYLAELIEQQQVTTLHFVPSMLSAFLETLEGQSALQAKLGSLNYLFCSGEALNVGEVRKCQRLLPHCQIHNLYGPTEATVDVLFYDCNARSIKDVLIGKPIDNTSAYVLNAQMQPIPPGAIGELFIGGVGVARGYMNNKLLTDKAFLSNPFQSSEEKGRGYNGRMYKTGDVVRYLADGNIQYLGRNDFQVKVRGYRIELGEIETRLASYPDVNHAVVIASERGSNDKYLVAYYVAAQEIPTEKLCAHLRETLPDYMVPSVFVHLTALPVTSNGKLNRRLLPEPQITHSVTYVAPENKVEKTLCELLADTLQVSFEAISMEDNFFALGGNSILAMRLNNRINQVLRVKIRLLDIINARTLSELSQAIAQAQGKSFEVIVPFNTVTQKPQMFMVHPGMGNCSVYQSLANRLSERYCCYGVDSYNFYHEQKIERLGELARYYLEHIDRILDVSQPVTLLGWSLGGKIALEIAAYLEARGVKAITVYLLDTWLLSEDHYQRNESSFNLDSMMERLQIPHYLRHNVESVVVSDKVLNIQPLSAVLKHTQIVLFKAMEEIGYEEYQQYRFNNVDAGVENIAQLQLFEIAASHFTLLEKEDELISHIR